MIVYGETHVWPVNHPERLEKRPCKVCGEPIQPGQIYVPGPPLHFGCVERRYPRFWTARNGA